MTRAGFAPKPIDVDKLVDTALDAAHAHSTHLCLRYVREALGTQGVANQTRAATAIGSLEYFRQNQNFEEKSVTASDLENLPKGAVVIIRNPRGGAGHIEIARGDGTAVSDFIQKSMIPYRGASEFYAFVPKVAVSNGQVSKIASGIPHGAASNEAVVIYGGAEGIPIPELMQIMERDRIEREKALKKSTSSDTDPYSIENDTWDLPTGVTIGSDEKQRIRRDTKQKQSISSVK